MLNNALNNAIAAHVGSLFNGGTLVLYDGASAEIEFDLGTPAFGTPSNGTLKAEGLPISETISVGAIEIDSAALVGPGGSEVTGLTVGLAGSGAQVVLSSLSPADGETLKLLALTYYRSNGIDSGH